MWVNQTTNYLLVCLLQTSLYSIDQFAYYSIYSIDFVRGQGFFGQGKLQEL